MQNLYYCHKDQWQWCPYLWTQKCTWLSFFDMELCGTTRSIDPGISNFTRWYILTLCKFGTYVITTCDHHSHFCDLKMANIGSKGLTNSRDLLRLESKCNLYMTHLIYKNHYPLWPPWSLLWLQNYQNFLNFQKNG